MNKMINRKFGYLLLFILLGFSSCIDPELHLPDQGNDIEIDFSRIRMDISVLWNYDVTYDWEQEWSYGWDESDKTIFGDWNIQEPHIFNIRRYYKGDDPDAPHTRVNEHQINSNNLTAHYSLGYYDILTWNEITTLDGVQSLHFDESTTLEYVTAYTNKSPHAARYAPGFRSSYYQPEFLYSGYYQNMAVTNNPEDYDYYNEEENLFYKEIQTVLDPRTYIYLIQIVLRNNRGRIVGVDGTANISGMAQSCNLNTGVTGADEISVNYDVQLKEHCIYKDEDVDVIGGRLITFGLCNLNPYHVTRAGLSETTTSSSFIDVEVSFNNGNDSTFVFDVTDQILNRYKGGVITVTMDVDSIPIPTRSGGSGFDAEVADYENEQHEFDM